MIIFETERLLVRQYTADDFDNFFALNGNAEVMRYIRPAKSLEETRLFLDENLISYKQMPGMGRWAVHEKSTNDFIGTFAIIPFDDHREPQIGYALLKEFWGKGFASELLREGLQYAFSELQLDKIFAVTDIGNANSQKVLEKSDFVFLKHQHENGKTLSIYELQKPIEVFTGRLKIFPLTYRQLQLYLKANNLFEKRFGLTINNRIVSQDVKDLVETGILSKMATSALSQHLYYTFWIVVDVESNTIVAELGFKGPPNENGEVEIGYGTMPSFTGKGYMTEAVSGMIRWATKREDIKAILAETDEHNTASIRIVEKNNFTELEKKKNMRWWRKSVK